MKHGTTITLLTCSFIPEKQLTDISETLAKKTVRTNRTTWTKTETKRAMTLPKEFEGHQFTEMENREKIQPQQNEQYLMQIPTQTLQCHHPKKLQKLAPPMKPKKLQQHQDRMTKTGPTTLTITPLITTTKVRSNLAPANQLNNLPLYNES